MDVRLSNIHPGARIGKNVKIDSFVTIEEDVEIGDGTWIGPNVTIFGGARIGAECKIFPGAVISAIPQDLKYSGEKTFTFIGNNTTIREYVTINKGTSALGKTQVGSGCLLMAYVHIAHDSIVGDNCILANGVTLAGHIVIDDFAIIGGLSAIHQFVHIGSHVMISGGSLIRKDVPPYTKAAREPLSYVGVNSVGLKRRGFSTQSITEIQEIYRVLFQNGLNLSQAIEYLSQFVPDSSQKEEIIQFVRNSARGIMKGYVSIAGKSRQSREEI
jgi:UDP-N-acetylglucosamine acyltransferase